MIVYEKDGALVPLDEDAYYVQTETDGWDNTLNFTLPVGHLQAPDMKERLRLTVTETIEGRTAQVYAVSGYNKSGTSLAITAELDLDDWNGGVILDGTNDTATLADTIKTVLPTDWTLIDNSGRTDSYLIEDFNGTFLEYLQEAIDTWEDVAAQFDNVQKTVTLYATSGGAAKGTYFTPDLNLTETPSIKGTARAGTYYNRLYLTGKDGLELPSPGYVEDLTYDSHVVCAYKSDTSVTTQEALVSLANHLLETAAVPDRAYTCKLVNLAKLRPKDYGFLTFAVNDIIVLLDPDTYSRSYQRITRTRIYPNYPEKDTVNLSTVPGTISRTISLAQSRAKVAQTQAAIAKESSDASNATASAALTTANTASSTANTASSTASTAKSTADDALYTAKYAAISADRITTGTLKSADGTLSIDLSNNTFKVSGNATFSGSITGGTINIGSKSLYINSSGYIGATGTVGGKTGLFKGESGSVYYMGNAADQRLLWFCKGLYVGWTQTNWVFGDDGGPSTWSG